jgi:DNA adenine methylase
MSRNPAISVTPIVRWAGGKRWLVPHLKMIARTWSPTAYYEPFAGGAAAFFGHEWPHAHLSDINDDLIAMYRGIRGDAALVRRRLRALPHNRETFEIVKTSRPRSDIARAVRMLYLNRLAYGGIYRTDRNGTYNVPYSGDRTTTSLWQGDRLEQTAYALQGAALGSGDFEANLCHVQAGALVYCDPAYALPELNGAFRRYAAAAFSWSDQRRLAEVVHELKSRGALVVVSNSSDDRVAQLFRPDITLTFDRRVPLPKAGGRALREAVYVLAKGEVARMFDPSMFAGASV